MHLDLRYTSEVGDGLRLTSVKHGCDLKTVWMQALSPSRLFHLDDTKPDQYNVTRYHHKQLATHHIKQTATNSVKDGIDRFYVDTDLSIT